MGRWRVEDPPVITWETIREMAEEAGHVLHMDIITAWPKIEKTREDIMGPHTD